MVMVLKPTGPNFTPPPENLQREMLVHIRGQNVTQGLLQVFALAVCHLFRHGMVPAGLTGQVMSLRVQLTETVMN
ncbi:hypothetical protein AWE93_26045 [Escherichia coli]|nr:hypothetical protein AWE93_26045 [Escherichia coli]KZH18065.1 hypothetical protein AWG35_16140 [Escherichia coli]